MSVQLQFRNAASLDVQTVIDDHFMAQLNESLSQIGQIRFARYIKDEIWVAFMNHAHALDAYNQGEVNVAGHEMRIELKHPNWRDLLQMELGLCSSKSIPLCATVEKDLNMKKESAQLFKQLSQLSFEELEGRTVDFGLHCSSPTIRASCFRYYVTGDRVRNHTIG